MGFLDKKLNEEKLSQLSYLDYLKWIQKEVGLLSYSKGDNSDVYWYAKEIVSSVINRYIKENGLTMSNYTDTEIGSNLKSTQVSIEDFYKYDKTHKMKSRTISEFKTDIDDDITRIIYQIENNG
ncbi:MAG: hypothetical protein R2796_06970 [Chitinophagaceae bacterium]